jgi:drug/metabolite transporter (DMT)-like permease
MEGSSPRAIPVLLLGVVAISCAALFVRLCDAPALIIAAYRLGGALLLLLPLALARRAPLPAQRHPKSAPWILLSGGCLGLHFLAWIAAVQEMPVALASTLASTHPVMVGALSWALMGEAMNRTMAVGIAMSLLGTVLMGWVGQGRGGFSFQGAGLALAAASCFSVYILVGRKLRRDLPLGTYLLPTYGAAAVLVWGLVWITGLPVTGYDAHTYGMFALLALVPTAIGHTSFNWALAHVSATAVTVSTLGEPVAASILALVLLGETPDPLKLSAGVVILVGIFLAARSEVSGAPRQRHPAAGDQDPGG